MASKGSVLFIIPPVTERIWSNHYKEIYLGLAYVAEQAEANGFECKIIDCDATFITLRHLEEEVIQRQPDFVGITALYGSLDNAGRIADICRKNSNATVIMGGLPATFIPEHILRNFSVDIVVRGEGEQTFLEILKRRNRSSIKGISYLKAGAIRHNPDRELIADLDSLGMPLRDIFPLKKYRIRFKLHNSTSIETARGCPYGCDFCTQQPKEGTKLRFRSPSIVIEELRRIQDRHPFIKRIMIVDNDFLTNQQHAEAILTAIVIHRLNQRFHFMIATRIRNLQRGGDSLLDLLKRANVKTIFLGIESVSDQCVRQIGKIKSRQDTVELFRAMEALGIDPMPSYIIGFPNETLAGMEDTLEFAKELNTKIFSFNILTPYPGTRFFEECKRKQEFLDRFEYGLLDNAHQVIRHSVDLEREFNRMHRRYMFRWKYFSRIQFVQLHKHANSGRLAYFAYYLVFMELATHIRKVTRIIKKSFFGSSCFLT